MALDNALISIVLHKVRLKILSALNVKNIKESKTSHCLKIFMLVTVTLSPATVHIVVFA